MIWLNASNHNLGGQTRRAYGEMVNWSSGHGVGRYTHLYRPGVKMTRTNGWATESQFVIKFDNPVLPTLTQYARRIRGSRG